ncbi:hypothetical protein HOY82DRAFT_483158 [Tuber indicum]|nr:hypothetical protein HOY82DRAFT_483158 [Tuber indicum]
MAHPNDSLWLAIARHEEQIYLLEYDRLQTLAVGSLTNTQPVLIALIEDDTKSRALSTILTGHQGRPGVHLHYHSHAGMAEPLLFADCGLLNLGLNSQMASPDRSNSRSKPSARRPLLWLRGEADGHGASDQARHMLCGRLLGPFTDIICIFTSDVGGLWGVVRVLSYWSDLLEVGMWFPEVVMIWEQPPYPSPSPVVDSVAPQLLYDMLCTKGILYPMAWGIQVVEVSDADILVHILTHCHRARRRRRESQTLYSLSHMIALFRRACDHASTTMDISFNPIITSRYLNAVPQTLSVCLEAFLHMLGHQHFNRASWMIAASIAFNAMPPGMHTFPPDLIFDTLYRGKCEIAIRKSQMHSPITFLENIRCLVQDEICSVHSYERWSAEYHLMGLKREWGPINKPITDMVRFVCLVRFPERKLPCGHSFCEICLEVFGARCKVQPYTISIGECMICFARFNGVRVHIKPPTAGARILTVDGGGIRGVVALSSLIQHEAAIFRIVGVELPIQECFDLAIGTSSGGLIVLGLFSRGWSVDECLQEFIRLASRAFTWRPRLPFLPILHRAIDYILSFVVDSRYSADHVEVALKEAFGTEQNMFTADNNRTKVAVTATTTKSLPCIFASYNSGRVRPTDCGRYQRPPPESPDIVDMEGYTPIQPYNVYFSPKRLAGLGTFQDGGLCQNNPSCSALSESEYIWPGAPEPDNVVSICTGSALYTPYLTEGSPTTLPPPSIGSGLTCGNRFLVWAYRSYMYLLDGEPAWQRLVAGLPVKRRNRFYRLNIQILGREPAIDDTAEMPRLCMTSPPLDALNATAWAIIASLFFFELERLPIREQEAYVCEGRIQCQLGIGSQKLLHDALVGQQAWFASGGELLSSNNGSAIRFKVVDLRAEVTIDLHGQCGGSWPIGGSPFMVQELVHRQGLHSPFGTANHLKRGPREFGVGPPAKRQCVGEALHMHGTGMMGARQSLAGSETVSDIAGLRDS